MDVGCIFDIEHETQAMQTNSHQLEIQKNPSMIISPRRPQGSWHSFALAPGFPIEGGVTGGAQYYGALLERGPLPDILTHVML